MQRRTKPNPRARRSLLYGAGCFLLLQAGLLLSLERRGLAAFDPCSCKRLHLLGECRRARPGSPLCLVMGSSRVDMAFQPESLPESAAADGRAVTFFNFSNYGAGPLMQWLLLQRLRDQGVRPDWLVLELTPPYLCYENNHFFTGIVPAREMPLVAPYVPAWQLAQYGLRRRWELLPGHCLDLLQRHTGLALGGPRLPQAPHRLPLGGTVELASDLPEQVRRERFERQVPFFGRDLSRFAISPRSDRVLRDLLAECRRDAIDVTLVLTPEGPRFRSLYAPGSDAVLAGYLDELHRQTGVAIVSARDWLDEADFTDSHHPTATGARKFTSRFYACVLQPLVSRPQAPHTMPALPDSARLETTHAPPLSIPGARRPPPR